MIALFGLGGRPVSRQQVSAWLKRDEDPAFKACHDELLASFLNGLIVHFRGSREQPPPEPERKLTNNVILRKLKIALALKDTDVLELLSSADMVVSKPELSALFRKPEHKHYRECQDQLLRRFLKGLALSRADASLGNPPRAPGLTQNGL
jgi:uncharacterized protein YehS (DUF1456 family)